MAKNKKFHTAKNARELAALLEIDPADAIEMDFRAKINKKIIDTVKNKKLTHDVVAKLAKTSRPKITRLLNGNTASISTDLLLRILYSLGYKANLSFSQTHLAA